jgi:hypothetical protein
MYYRNSRDARVPVFGATITLLILLATTDLVFILIHSMHVWSSSLSGPHFSLESDNGLAALYQYIKQVWLLACLGLAFLQTRARAFIGWTMLFAFLLLDDLLQFHERFGELIAARLNYPAVLGLRPTDLGELTAAAAIGSVALALAAHTFRRGDRRARWLAADLLCLLAALAFFGVFADMLHTILYFKSPAIAPVFAMIEDGGEMLVVSAMTAYAFDITSSGGRLRIGVWAWVSRWIKARGFRGASLPSRI